MGWFSSNKSNTFSPQVSTDDKKALTIAQKKIVQGVIFAQKKKLDYKLIDFNSLDDKIKAKIIKSMETNYTSGGIYDHQIFPKQSILVGLTSDNPLIFNTFFISEGWGNKEMEEENIKYKIGSSLIKGPCGKIYQVSDYTTKYEKTGDPKIFTPKITSLKCIQVTNDIFNIMKISKKFIEKGSGLQIQTSYGGLHLVKKGDYLMIDGDEFYRIKKVAFDLTYEKITSGGSLTETVYPCLKKLNTKEKKVLNTWDTNMRAALTKKPRDIAKISALVFGSDKPRKIVDKAKCR